MADLNNLLNEAKFILAKAKVSRNESRLRGEQFNIFHACGVNHYETKHSAIIAEFLNPEGSHGQGDIYLKEFLVIILRYLDSFCYHRICCAKRTAGPTDNQYQEPSHYH